MEGIERLKNYPDVTFIEAISFEKLKESMVSDFEKRYRELTGNTMTLAAADPYRLILYACAVAIYQGYQYTDKAGKMGLLKYSTGDFLDNLAALKGITRNEAVPSRTTMRFTLSAVQSRKAVIPKGTRLKGQELYFETVEEGEIPAGELTADVPAVCQTSGAIGNGYREGDITTLVDPLPFNAKVSNVEITDGGADREEDADLAERIYLAPSKYSTAGPEPAYEYWVKTYNSAVDECRVITESPGEVDIYIMVDGKLPTESFIKELTEKLKNGEQRPLTDHVVVKAPETVKYEINFTYYLRSSDRDMVDTIQKAVENACNNFIAWQKKIGKDITPSQLISEIMQAGVQSVEIKKPSYTEISDSQIGITSEPVITYGGLRDG